MTRFQKELKLLGTYQLKVELVKTKTQKGHIYHQIKLQNCKENVRASEVLSEGEMWIVSLAAFLADVESWKSSTLFIYDDPISSLDQEYEESPETALNSLINERLSKAVKILNEVGQSEYETLAKAICSDFRVISHSWKNKYMNCIM